MSYESSDKTHQTRYKHIKHEPVHNALPENEIGTTITTAIKNKKFKREA